MIGKPTWWSLFKLAIKLRTEDPGEPGFSTAPRMIEMLYSNETDCLHDKALAREVEAILEV